MDAFQEVGRARIEGGPIPRSFLYPSRYGFPQPPRQRFARGFRVFVFRAEFNVPPVWSLLDMDVAPFF